MQGQNDAILEYLQEGHTLTPLDALNEFDCFRLSARIKDLRNKGYNVHTRMVDTLSGKKVAEYYIPCNKQYQLI